MAVAAVPASHCGLTTFTIADGRPADGGTDVRTDGGAHVDGKTDAHADVHTDAHADVHTDAPADTRPDVSETPVTFTSVTTLAKNQSSPKGIAVDAYRVYWANQDDLADDGLGSIMGALKNGKGTPYPLARGQAVPLDVAVGPVGIGGIYWSVNATTALPPGMHQCLLKVLPAGATDFGCVATSSNATTRMVVTSDNSVLLTMDSTGASYVGYAPLTAADGGLGSAYVNRLAQGSSVAIAASAGEMYVGNGGHIDTYAIPSLKVGGNVCTTCGNGNIMDIVFDDDQGVALWVTLGGSVMSAPFTPSLTSPAVLLATVDGTPQRIARDESYVYVTVDSTMTTGSVVAVARAGGAVTTLAAMQDAPFGIAVDTLNVYWTAADGTVKAVGRP